MNSVFVCVSLASSSSLVLRHLLTYSIILSLSSLFPSSSKALSCSLILSLTNLLIRAIVELYKPIVLSGLGLLDFLVPTISTVCGNIKVLWNCPEESWLM